MEPGTGDLAELTCNQKVFIVVGGQGKHARMLTEDGNVVVFESLWHAGPLVQELCELGFDANLVPMRLYSLYYLLQGMRLGLWVVRHNGTVTSVEDIILQGGTS